MADSLRDKLEALREEAYAKVQASPLYRDFAAIDDAVVAMGGSRRLMPVDGKIIRMTAGSVAEALANRTRRALSQGDAAYGALQEASRPMQIGELLEATRERGAEIKGADPLANFRSTLSRDDRFVSFRRAGQYLWWFKNMMVPTETGADLLAETPALSSANQEGGDRHAAAKIALDS